MREWLGHRWKTALPVGSLRARLALGTFWSLVGTVISQVLGLAASVVTARLLGQVGFGELGIINSTVGMLGVFSGLGLGTTATKYVAELRAVDAERAGRVLALSILSGVVSGSIVTLTLFLLAPLLALRTLNAPHLVDELRLGCALLFFGTLEGVQVGGLAGFEAFRTIAWVNLVRGLLYFPAMVAGTWFFGLLGGIGAMVLVAAAGWWISLYALHRECWRAGVVISLRGVKAEWGMLWNFSLPAFLSGIVTMPVTWAANTMLVNQPDGYAQMGLWSAADKWRLAIMFVPTSLGTVSLPILSNLHGAYDRSDYVRLLWSSLGAISGLTLLVALPVAVFSPWIMASYGADFVRGYPVLILLAASCVLVAANNIVGNGIVSTGAVWWGLAFNVLWAASFVTIARFTIYPLGAVGLAVAYLGSYLAHSVWQSFYLLRKLPNARGPYQAGDSNN